ncbi:MAG TPA: DUF3352 domain-containing protein, partial [Armatimonadota bacterium]|nr:DUF3352 domain-containing protein [Armatimonadota bacterium]
GRSYAGFVTAVAVLAALAAGGTMAYHHFFQRAGEGAAQLIPSDADMVITVDTMPSVNQVALFSRIAAAVKREDLIGRWNDLTASAIHGSEAAKRVEPFLKGSGAFAIWNLAAGAQPDRSAAVALLAIREPDKVRQTLSQYGQRKSQNGADYMQLGPKTYAEVSGDYLVVSNEPSILSRVEATRRGTAKSVGSLPDYRNARASLPHDPNVMMFVSGRALSRLSSFSNGAGGLTSATRPPAPRWTTVGATLEDSGIVIDTRTLADDRAIPSLKPLAGIQPLSPALLKELPSGAFGVMAISQPAGFWRYFVGAARQNPEMEKIAANAANEFRSETGLDLDHDILPEMRGGAAVAVYPGPAFRRTVGIGAASGSQLLVVFDSENGADPGSLAPRLMDAVIRLAHGTLRFTEVSRNGVTIWTAGSESGFTAAASSMAAGMLGGPASLAAGARPTLELAQAGRLLILASSPQIMDRALSVYHGAGQSLADDPAFQSMVRRWSPHAQDSLMVDLAAVMAAVKPLLAAIPTETHNALSADDIAGLFGRSGAGLVTSGGYDGHLGAGSFFLPLDYDRAIHVAAVLADQKSPSVPGPMLGA